MNGGTEEESESTRPLHRGSAVPSWTLLADTLLHDGYRKVRERRYLVPSGREQVFEITVTPDVVCALALDVSGDLI